MVENGDVET